jgi:hypothetical protein
MWGKQWTEIQKECLWQDKEQFNICCGERPTLYMDSVNKVPPLLMFPPEGISLCCNFRNIFAYMIVNTAVVFHHPQDIYLHLASHIVIYLKSSFLTLSKEFYCHSFIFRFCVTTLSLTLSFWFFSHYSILYTTNKELHFVLKTENSIHCQACSPPAPNHN